MFRVSLNLFRVFGLFGHVVSFSESHGACCFLEVKTRTQTLYGGGGTVSFVPLVVVLVGG